LIVLDASAINAVLLREPRAESVLRAIESEDSLLAPALVFYEVANALALAVRRGRITGEEASKCAQECIDLPWNLETHGSHAGMTRMIGHALANGLTAYDAAFLELAESRRCPLVTLDAELAKAARSRGIQVLP